MLAIPISHTFILLDVHIHDILRIIDTLDIPETQYDYSSLFLQRNLQ